MSQFMSIDEKKGTLDNPLVSIISTVLNGIKYLEASLQSVLNQSYPLIEYIFVDGGSSDGTVEMIASYRAMYPDRIRFFSEPGKGQVKQWNTGLKMAKGEILGWLGQDDMYEPDAIMAVVQFFKSNPDAYFVFGDCNRINEKGKIIGKFPIKDFNLEETINDYCYIPTPSAFYRREVIKKVGLMDTSINASDFDYWIRVGKVFQIHRIEKTLANFRIHRKSISGSRGAMYMLIREGFIISRRYGAGIFSPRGRRYIMFVILRPLLPILVPLYYLIKYKAKV